MSTVVSAHVEHYMAQAGGLPYHLGPKQHLGLARGRTLPQEQSLRGDLTDGCTRALNSSD